MAILSELSSIVKRRRSEMGLSQKRLAELAELSRATVSNLEAGKLPDLSIILAERLVNVLGLGLGMTGTRQAKSDSDITDALDTAARSGSISYRDTIPVETLRHTLVTGEVPSAYIPQLRALLDESPLIVLSAAVAQIEIENDVPREATWQRMRQLATALACTRGIWL